jgi:hypothetical protein
VLGAHRLRSRSRQWPHRSRVQVGNSIEHRELCACLFEGRLPRHRGILTRTTLRRVLGRSRFDELVRRQLDLFEVDAEPLHQEADAADTAWTNAAREETEELYGDYQLVVDQIAEQLLDLRETYASSLDERTAERYRVTFNRVALKRFRPYTALLVDET